MDFKIKNVAAVSISARALCWDTDDGCWVSDLFCFVLLWPTSCWIHCFCKFVQMHFVMFVKNHPLLAKVSKRKKCVDQTGYCLFHQCCSIWSFATSPRIFENAIWNICWTFAVFVFWWTSIVSLILVFVWENIWLGLGPIVSVLFL